MITLRTGRTRDTRPDGERGALDRRIAGLLGVAIVVIVLTVAHHMSGGGIAHSRYLFPALGALATVMVVGFDQIRPRVAPAVLVAVMALWVIGSIPTNADRAARPRLLPKRLPNRHLLSE